MSLLSQLGLQVPKSIAKAAPPPKPAFAAADAALVQQMNALFKSSSEAVAAAATPEQKEAALAAQKQINAVLTAAQTARKSALSMADESAREAALEKAKEQAEKQGRAALAKVAPQAAAMVDFVEALNGGPKEKEPELPGTTTKGKVKDKLILSKDSVGAGRSASGSVKQRDADGNAVTLSGSFGGKSWITVKPKSMSRDQVWEVSFNLQFGVDASLAGKLKQGSGFQIEAGKELTVSIHHDNFTTAEKDAYLALCAAGVGGAYAELLVAAALSQQKVDELKTLLKRLAAAGGSALGFEAGYEGMADGDRIVLEDVQKLGGQADLGAKSGLAEGGVQFGKSVVGTVTRTVQKSGRKWIFEYEAVDESTDSAGASGAYVAGGGAKAAKTVQTFVQLRFEVEQDDPKHAEHLKALSAADSLDALKALRTSLKGVRSTMTQGKGTGQSTEVHAKGGPAQLAVQQGTSRSSATTDGSDGQSLAMESGSNQHASVLSAFGQDLAGGGTQQTYTGASDQDNQGTAKVGQTSEQFDAWDSAKKLVTSPLAMAGVVTKGKDPITRNKRDKGINISDADFQVLVELAKSRTDWDHCGLYGGDSKAYPIWQKLRTRVAGGDRHAINAAMADFEEADGQGLLGIIRAALNRKNPKQAQEYELPPSLAGETELYDSFVRFDPLDEVRDAGDGEQMQRKLDLLLLQAGKLQEAIQKELKANHFHSPKIGMEMSKRFDAAIARLKKEGRILVAEAKAQQSLERKTDPEAEKRAEYAEKLAARRRDVETMKAAQATLFAEWDKELGSFFSAYKQDTYRAFRQRAWDIHSNWKQAMFDMRDMQREMGGDGSEAMRDGPDEAGLKRLSRQSKLE